MRTNRLFQQKNETKNNQVQPVTTVTVIGTGTVTGTKKKRNLNQSTRIVKEMIYRKYVGS